MFRCVLANASSRLRGLLPTTQVKQLAKSFWRFKSVVRYERPSTCSFCPFAHPNPRPCFDLSTVLVEKGGRCHEKLIRSFLYTHYWPREPSTVSLYMPLCSPFLSVLTERYSTSGDRWLAFELQPRTKERRLIGVLIAEKVFPWVADEYEEWAHNTCLLPERHSMYFRAHCLRSPNLFKKYHLSYIYNIEVLTTSADVTGQGVAELLLRTAILRAQELRHPLIQIVSKSAYTHDVCARNGMQREWEMKYADFIDMAGQSVFFPRRPHYTVALYVKKLDYKAGVVPEPWKNPSLFEVYKKQALIEKAPADPAEICGRPPCTFPLFPQCKT